MFGNDLESTILRKPYFLSHSVHSTVNITAIDDSIIWTELRVKFEQVVAEWIKRRNPDSR